MGDEAGGRVDPARVMSRPDTSTARQAFVIAIEEGWLDHDGWVTPVGYEALEKWRAAA
jgi:hypothetical protein